MSKLQREWEAWHKVGTKGECKNCKNGKVLVKGEACPKCKRHKFKIGDCSGC